MEKVILVRYCEIHLKGKNRGFFERLLQTNLKNALKNIKCDIDKVPGRYQISNFDDCDIEEIKNCLNCICGIHNYSIADKIETSLENIFLVAKEHIKHHSTFKVETNRADKTFPLNSIEISSEIGGKILEFDNSLKVDVKNPNFIIFIDIRENGFTYIYSDNIKGVGGMPSGSAGKGMLLISGGIDSPVAGYMMAKRGMKIDAIHFQSYPYTNLQAKEKVIELSKIISKYSVGLKLYIISFTKIQEAIHEHCPEELMITLMRRFMVKISERLAIKTGNQCIITGESLGQVASQTIEGITSSNSVIEELPILRPLIGFDKLDIIEISKKINTFDISILPYEDCCTVFLPKFPAIKPKLNKIINAEESLNIENLIQEALNSIEILEL